MSLERVFFSAEKLLGLATSVPGFRRTGKGNIRHRLEDVLVLIILARMSRCIGHADIIEFGRHNLTRFRSMGMLKNGVPSEPSMCRIENGIDDSSIADSIRAFMGQFHDELTEFAPQSMALVFYFLEKILFL